MASSSKVQPKDFTEEGFEQLRQDYALVFKSEHGKRFLQDLIGRFDPVLIPPPMTGEQAMYVAGCRAPLAHINDMAGEEYAKAMGTIARRGR